MKKFTNNSSSTFEARTATWLTMAAALLPILALFFKPTLLEFIAFYLIDALAFMLLVRLDVRLFRRYFPESRLFFPKIDSKAFEIKDYRERADLFRNIMDFPSRRAIYIGICSTIKLLPAYIFVFTVWGNAHFTLELHVKGFLVVAFTFSFYMGMSYLDCHDRMTKVLREIHAKADWSELFRSLRIPRAERLLARFENLCLFSILIFCFGLSLLIHNDESIPKWLSTFEITYVMLSALLMGWQLMHASRSFLRNGMDALVDFYRGGEHGFNRTGIALSTYPTLAQFEQALNSAVEKCVASEREIHEWIMQKAEDHRFLSLGRLTGLLMHDLVNPISAIRLRIRALYKKLPLDQVDDVRKIEFGLNNVTEMVVNVRNSIRDQASQLKSSSFRISHENAVQLVKYVFKTADEQSFLSRLTIAVEDDWDALTNIPHIELTQILMNLYQNSLTNMLKNRVYDARLTISKYSESNDFVVLSLVDTGTGLSSETFQLLTEGPERMPGAGIGLKLTRRLLERYGGSLHVIDDAGRRGTHFLLTLKRGNPGEEIESVPWIGLNKTIEGAAAH